jgi:hypothetical protein
VNETTKPALNPDDLTKATEAAEIELKEEDLSRISGGDGIDVMVYKTKV